MEKQETQGGYAVIHNHRVVDTSNSIAGAHHKAMKFGNTLPHDDSVHIYDLSNQMHVRTLKTEPLHEFEEGGGDMVKSVNQIPSTLSTDTGTQPPSALVKGEDEHKIFKIKMITPKDNDEACFAKVDDSFFNLETGDEVPNPNGGEIPYKERGVYPSEIATLAISGLLEKSDLESLHEQGYPCSAAKKVLNLMDEIKNKIKILNQENEDEYIFDEEK